MMAADKTMRANLTTASDIAGVAQSCQTMGNQV
jgi:hypothetical protein